MGGGGGGGREREKCRHCDAESDRYNLGVDAKRAAVAMISNISSDSNRQVHL